MKIIGITKIAHVKAAGIFNVNCTYAVLKSHSRLVKTTVILLQCTTNSVRCD